MRGLEGCMARGSVEACSGVFVFWQGSQKAFASHGYCRI